MTISETFIANLEVKEYESFCFCNFNSKNINILIRNAHDIGKNKLCKSCCNKQQHINNFRVENQKLLTLNYNEVVLLIDDQILFSPKILFFDILSINICYSTVISDLA